MFIVLADPIFIMVLPVKIYVIKNVCVCACLLQEVVRQSILINQIPRAQDVLRRRSCPEQHLSALRMKGLHQVFSCLQHRDLQTASTLLSNMVRTPISPLFSVH